MAQAFDFGALLQNPGFQFGTSLLAGARQPGAVSTAYAGMQRNAELHQQAQLQAAQIENYKAEQAARQQQLGISQSQFERQSKQTEMQILMEQHKLDMQDNFMKQLQGSGLFGPAPQQGAPKMQPQSFHPSSPQASITPQLLDSLAQVESSGNPNAVNPQSGAQGLFQFMPATAKAIGIDPMNPQQARAGAAQYLQNLTQQNGGSLERALAAYGGFKTKDPTPYIQKVLAGAGMQQGQQPQDGQDNAPGAPVNVGNGMANPGLQLGMLGMGAGIAGLQGGAQIMEMGKMMAPQNVPAGSYQRDPVTGKMQYIQDPMATAKLAMDQQRLGMEGTRVGMEGSRLSMEQQKQRYEQGTGAAGTLPQKALDAVNAQRYETANTEINKSLDTHKELPNQLLALDRAQKDVAALVANRSALTPVGYAANAKLAAMKAFRNTFGYDAPKDVQNAEDFNSAMAQLWMKAVKQVDQNPTANQQKSIMASFGTLNNDPAALTRILGETKVSFINQMQRHNKAVAQYEGKIGADPFSRYLDTGDTTPAGTKVGGQEHGYTYIGGNPSNPSSWTK